MFVIQIRAETRAIVSTELIQTYNSFVTAVKPGMEEDFAKVSNH